MSVEIALVIAAVLVAAGIWLGWKVVQGRMRGDDKAPPPPAVAEAPVARVEAPAAAPRPPSVAAPAPGPAPAPSPAPSVLDAPVPVTVIMAPRPPAPVIERVLAVEPASQAEWDAAVPLTLSAAESASGVA